MLPQGSDGAAVFYNNAQIFNRDLSVLVARLVLKQKRDEDAAKLAKIAVVLKQREKDEQARKDMVGICDLVLLCTCSTPAYTLTLTPLPI